VRNFTHICKKILQIFVNSEKSSSVGPAPGLLDSPDTNLKMEEAGLPDGFFSDPKIPIWKYFGVA
jgi:hypothetical protein